MRQQHKQLNVQGVKDEIKRANPRSFSNALLYLYLKGVIMFEWLISPYEIQQGQWIILWGFIIYLIYFKKC